MGGYASVDSCEITAGYAKANFGLLQKGMWGGDLFNRKFFCRRFVECFSCKPRLEQAKSYVFELRLNA